MDLYPARVACKIAGISARKLDYWVTTGIISPHSVYRGPEERRDFFLFSFTELLQLRVVASLRSTGLSLQKIRDAVARLAREEGSSWHSLWLISDGNDLSVVRKTDIVETLTGTTRGQLSFAVVAMGTAHEDVQGELRRMSTARFRPERYRGQVLPFTYASLG